MSNTHTHVRARAHTQTAHACITHRRAAQAHTATFSPLKSTDAHTVCLRVCARVFCPAPPFLPPPRGGAGADRTSSAGGSKQCEDEPRRGRGRSVGAGRQGGITLRRARCRKKCRSKMIKKYQKKLKPETIRRWGSFVSLTPSSIAASFSLRKVFRIHTIRKCSSLALACAAMPLRLCYFLPVMMRERLLAGRCARRPQGSNVSIFEREKTELELNFDRPFLS